MKKNTKKMVLMALYVSMALMLHVFESMIPVPFIAPGVKLGLANIVTMVAILTLSFPQTFTVVITRVILGSVVGGGFTGFLYSMAGGVTSFVSMMLLLVLFRKYVSPVGVSVTGAVFHSVGQLAMASILFSNVRLFSYFPILAVTSIVTGFFVGLASLKFIGHYEKITL